MIHDIHEQKLFPTLTPEVVDQLQAIGTVRELRDGEQILAEGDADYPFHVVLQGQIRVLKRVHGEMQEVAVHSPGQFLGEMSMLTGGPAAASAFARGPSRVISVPVSALRGVSSDSLRKVIMTAINGRAQELASFLLQQEKLAALGTMAATLAHELNNPAAAARRTAGYLKEAIAKVQTFSIQNDCRFSDGQREWLLALQRQLAKQGAALAPLDSLDRSDREDALGNWLQEHGIGRGWEMAPALVRVGATVADLDGTAARLNGVALEGAIHWLEATLAMSDLSAELENSVSRISDLVQAMKQYSYMDQAAFQEIDIHDGLDSTLKIFGPKLEGIQVVREYDRSVPRISAYAGELNQVWTNLIDNAADALKGKGRLTIRTQREPGGVLVEFADTGEGIPKAIQPRIFEPFFTTKPPGQGTGLGLDVAYRIVAHRHHGSLEVRSQPGDTRFEVRLPNHEKSAV